MACVNMAVPGAFIYVEGVFYVDRRRNLVDYAGPIIAFCHEHGISPPAEVGNDAEAFPERRRHSKGDSEDLVLIRMCISLA